MARRDEIIAFLDELLEPAGFADYCPNGLQVPGADEVDLVATGVSAQRALFEAAAGAGAQLVLCHHGLFWDGAPRAITETMRGRLHALFEADLSLAAYHLPLDAHPEVGNNALLCQLLGLARGEPFADHRGRSIGFVGRSEEGVALEGLIEGLTMGLGREPLVFASGPPVVHSIGIVSGGAAEHLRDAIAAGLDAFLTGEPAEYVMSEAHEAGIHFLAAGHYATETLGVRRLGELLAERFGVAHRFLDLPNPV